MHTDPLTFEVMRHRVSSIADEGSAVLGMVSSSPVAAEANDCNVAIMDRAGAAIAIGPGLSSHGIACMMTTRYVQAEYAENPGIREGDMFLANDPYQCTPHQTCIALVCPVVWDGRVVAWVGAGIHLPDMGGPVAGQVSVGADSIFQEATPMLPLRIVEQGRIRKDIEAEYVIRSRTPQQIALDLRALIAACNRLTTRLHEMFATYGAEATTGAFEDVVQFTRAHLLERLKTVPDGDWESRVWLDYPEEDRVDFYTCRLVLSKLGERLVLDFTDCSSQAPAVINCGEPGLISAVLNGLMTLLGYGLPLCPEGMLRTVELRSRPGTFVHAVHPAGCSKATTAACHAIREAINVAVGKMLLAAPALESSALAGSSGFLPVMELAGIDQRGDRFGVPLLDIGLSAGYGAMPDRDGIDSGGTLGSPFSSIANVETYEYRYPILYLWRRHEPDSGGLGQYRGGRGISLAFTPHRISASLGIVLHGLGCSVPSTPGLAGGYPGATNTFALIRASDAWTTLRRGWVPGPDDPPEGQFQPAPGLYKTTLAEGDVLLARNNGGGGFGDPLERDPAAVLEDLVVGAVSPEWASRGYGVLFDEDQIDGRATIARREQMRRARIPRARRPRAAARLAPAPRAGALCPRCGEPVAEERCARRQVDLRALGPAILPYTDEPILAAEEVCCARCGMLLDVRITPACEPLSRQERTHPEAGA
jgi:N-methylhydantoinase B